MEQETRRLSGSSSQTKLRGATNLGPMKHDLARQFDWEIGAINVYLQDIRDCWARTIGVSRPQWTILTALFELDKGEGVPVNAVSKLLQVDPSFVSTQSKLLEKKGFVRRKTSGGDARVVQMTLTDKSCKHIAGLTNQQEELNNFVFSDFSDRELIAFMDKLVALKRRLEKARLKVEIGI